MTAKIFVDEQTVIDESFRLGVQVYNSGFRPTFIVGLWRGGSTVGIYLQECLQTLGVTTDHIALRTSYAGRQAYESAVSDPQQPVSVHGTHYLIDALNRDDRLLLVDDVFASGRTMAAVIEKLSERLKRNLPADIRIACLFQRDRAHRVGPTPEYVAYVTEDWVTLPYELNGLSATELDAHKPAFKRLVATYGLTLPSLTETT